MTNFSIMAPLIVAETAMADSKSTAATELRFQNGFSPAKVLFECERFLKGERARTCRLQDWAELELHSNVRAARPASALRS